MTDRTFLIDVDTHLTELIDFFTSQTSEQKEYLYVHN